METTAPALVAHDNPRSRARGRLVRIASIAFTLVVVGAWFMFLRPSALGGPATYVIVAGASMEPELHSNDLVVAFEQSAYSVGDVVVYRVPTAEPGGGTHIVHRIVGGDPHRGFLVKGDSREGPDHWEPTADEIVGKMQLSIPYVGSGVIFLQTPLGLALLAGLTTLLIALGASAGQSAGPRQRR